MTNDLQKGNLMPLLEQASRVLSEIPESLIPNRRITVDYRGFDPYQVHIERVLPSHRIQLVFWLNNMEIRLLNGSIPHRYDEEKELVIRYEYSQVQSMTGKIDEMIRVLSKRSDMTSDELLSPFIIQ
jgi:hypothetical protein